ncbi:MAG: HAMP domain-containing protein [Marinospirillum sp.]|uniref:ATP-binding protein n=1 Tax=Marinospirillum sp. TaxID=2183934 RepID=UPI0019FC44F7|nr:ATP-binding protein [Marinospirillum sp.]MBE0506939.1 HAMP domain-containing protein [Marinospirillum sp.]
MKGLRRLWPGGLAGQLILLILLALLVGQLISFWILADERRERLHEANLRQVSQKLITTYELVRELPESARLQLLLAVSTPGQNFSLDEQPLVTPDSSTLTSRLHQRLMMALPEPRPEAAFRFISPNHPACDTPEEANRPGREERRRNWHLCQPRLEASLKLASDRWLNLQVVTPEHPTPWSGRIWISLLVTALLVALVVILSVRNLVKPLKSLTEAARRFARGESQPVVEQGPKDLQQVIHAFNQMQQQVGQQLEERARLLAALSHDLRTPLTHMRLRVELLPDSEDKQRLLDSLLDMQQLAETTLDFVRGSSSEKPSDFDLGALIQSLCDDYADQGQAVYFNLTDIACLYRGRSQAIKRALQNLIDNALKYGKSAEVTLDQQHAHACIRIVDEGPGIPATELDRVFEPFYRIENSRSQETGGSGLGLSIARNLMQREGGRLELKARTDGKQGLQVELLLPV